MSCGSIITSRWLLFFFFLIAGGDSIFHEEYKAHILYFQDIFTVKHRLSPDVIIQSNLAY